MELQKKLKLGTFVRNVLLSRNEFYEVIHDTGITKATDPVYILEDMEYSHPEILLELLESAQKNVRIKDLAKQYLEEIS